MAAKRRKIQCLAIANRGEVAVRIIRACDELGIKSVLLHSEPDRDSMAFRMASAAVCIGGASAGESYLSIERVLAGAKSAGADAIHPGFGFLSENASFAQAVGDAGLIFVGPSPKSISTLGDKISARALMEAAGVPVSPGYQGQDQSNQRLQNEAQQIGLPVIIKAAAGGGGRGMKLVRHVQELGEQLAAAKREALAAFGSDQVFIEKYIEGAKHIEFQVFGDSFGNVVHLYERECSIQRRHQKIIEESPSPSLTPELRKKMSAAAVAAAKSVGYEGAGTVEFLLKGADFYFLEMNTRLQVEHPVTELVVGVDLVKAQIKVAEGSPLPWTQEELSPRGAAIECRLYAEDPYQGGIPSTGLLLETLLPLGPGRRFDMGFEPGDVITPHYDPMIGKVIVWDTDRQAALQKMICVLKDLVIFGVQTNAPFLQQILSHPLVQAGTMSIQFIQQEFPEGLLAQSEPSVRGPRQPILSELERAFAEFSRDKSLVFNSKSGEVNQGRVLNQDLRRSDLDVWRKS